MCFVFGFYLRGLNCPFRIWDHRSGQGQFYGCHGSMLSRSWVSCATVFRLLLVYVWPSFEFGKTVCLCIELRYA